MNVLSDELAWASRYACRPIISPNTLRATRAFRRTRPSHPVDLVAVVLHQPVSPSSPSWLLSSCRPRHNGSRPRMRLARPTG
jgi:hypothetical protein